MKESDLSVDGAMNDERCLFILALIEDGRRVDPQVQAAAQAWAQQHPACALFAEGLAADRRALGQAAPLRASAGFTERVVQAARPSFGDTLPGLHSAEPVLSLGRVRLLALAASLLLLASLAFSLARPGSVLADQGLQRHRHVADHFRPDPFGPEDLVAGLRARLQDPEFGAKHP
ncbi:MAG: hypothetical protein ACT4PU_04070 [Planctomycetota bacterium]